MPTAVIGIGLPGSGKTTLLKQQLVPSSSLYVCPDDIREQLTGDAGDQSVNRQAWNEAYRQVTSALKNGQDVVIDATNARQADRRRLLAHCRENGADNIIGIWVKTPLDECIKRNLERKLRRERYVPGDKVQLMDAWLTQNPPSTAEGFDELMLVG